jgi:hypothetical protein
LGVGISKQLNFNKWWVSLLGYLLFYKKA